MINEEVNKEELLNFVSSGNGFLLKFYTIEYKDGIGKFWFTNGEEDAILKVKLKNKLEFEELKKAVKDILKTKYGRVVYKEEKKEEGKEKEEGKPSLRVTESLKLLDRTFAQQIAAYAKRQAWFSEIIESLGISAFFMILQLADVPAERWYDSIQKYKDKPEEFLKFADEFLVALFQAKTDAKKLIELRQELCKALVENELLKMELNETNELLQDVVEQLNAATAMLSKDKLQKFAMWNALRRMSKTQSQPQVEVVNKEGEGNE